MPVRRRTTAADGAGVSFLRVSNPNHQDETRAAYDGVVELYASMFADRLDGCIAFNECRLSMSSDVTGGPVGL